MKVVDGLSPIFTGIRDDSVAGFIDTLEFCNLLYRPKEFPEQFGWYIISNVIIVLLGDDKRMDGKLRIDIIEGKDIIILVDDACWNLTRNKLAE
jgi:hypothetical protein